MQCLTLIWWVRDTAPLVGCTKSAQVKSWHYNSIQTTSIKEEQINNKVSGLSVTVGDFEQSGGVNLSWNDQNCGDTTKITDTFDVIHLTQLVSQPTIAVHCSVLTKKPPIAKYVITYRNYKLTDLETLRSHLLTDPPNCWWHGKTFQCWHVGTNGKTWSSVYKTSGDMTKKCSLDHW